MKGWTILLHVGWCRPGVTGGPVPELRLGVVRVAWCRGWLGERVRGRELLAVGIALEHVLGSLRLSPREIETLTRQAQGGSQ